MTRPKKQAKTIKVSKPPPAPQIADDDAFTHIGGLKSIQAKLHNAVILPLLHPKSVRKLGIKPAHGILLYGPPGIGKAQLASAVARAAKVPFHAVTASHILLQHYRFSFAGKAAEFIENPIVTLFAKAAASAPAILFIDEIDILVPPRGKGVGDPDIMDIALASLITELDNLANTPGIIVIAATHRPNLVDPALLNPGRFDELVYVPVPDAAGRAEILGKLTANMPLAKDVDLAAIAQTTERFTGADLDDVVRRAGLQALTRSLSAKSVTKADFDAALADSRASVTADMEKDYEAVAGQIKQAALQSPVAVGFIAPGMVKPVRAEKHGAVRD